jgi:hypothetical protein
LTFMLHLSVLYLGLLALCPCLMALCQHANIPRLLSVLCPSQAGVCSCFRTLDR